MLYFQKDNRKIGYEKSNNMSMPYTMTLLRKVEMDYICTIIIQQLNSIHYP